MESGHVFEALLSAGKYSTPIIPTTGELALSLLATSLLDRHIGNRDLRSEMWIDFLQLVLFTTTSALSQVTT
jgi:hypothetical protein